MNCQYNTLVHTVQVNGRTWWTAVLLV